ncbi:MAG: hypothetical protein LBJ81_02630, partial [Puniceicoccales bacterium]|nr:hypothetical protein [Puniceicoccales bacterium]
ESPFADGLLKYSHSRRWHSRGIKLGHETTKPCTSHVICGRQIQATSSEFSKLLGVKTLQNSFAKRTGLIFFTFI